MDILVIKDPKFNLSTYFFHNYSMKRDHYGNTHTSGNSCQIAHRKIEKATMSSSSSYNSQDWIFGIP